MSDELRPIDELKSIAQEIESATGISVTVLTPAVIGSGYEIAVNGKAYGPFKTDCAKVWLHAFWTSVTAEQNQESRS